MKEMAEAEAAKAFNEPKPAEAATDPEAVPGPSKESESEAFTQTITTHAVPFEMGDISLDISLPVTEPEESLVSSSPFVM